MIQQRLFNESVLIVVRKGTGSIIYDQDLQIKRIVDSGSCEPCPRDFADEVDRVDRVPREHAGWQSVRYQKKRYQLFGGIRTLFFICLNSPI